MVKIWENLLTGINSSKCAVFEKLTNYGKNKRFTQAYSFIYAQKKTLVLYLRQELNGSFETAQW